MPWRETCAMDERLRFVLAAVEDEAVMNEICAEFGISHPDRLQVGSALSGGGARGTEGSQSGAAAPWPGARGGRGRGGSFFARAPSDLGPQEAARHALRASARCGDAGQEHDPRLAAQGGADALATAAASLPAVCFALGGGERAQFGVVRRLQGLVSDRRRAARRSLHDQRCDEPLSVALRGGGQARRGALPPGVRGGVLRVRPAAGDPLGQRAAVRLGGRGRLSRLSVWWIKLGVRPERIDRGKPQQNGRHERLHRTLKEDAVSPPAATTSSGPSRSATSTTMNGRTRPWISPPPRPRFYCASPRAYPCALHEPDYPAEAAVRRVRTNGVIKWAGDLVFISPT